MKGYLTFACFLMAFMGGNIGAITTKLWNGTCNPKGGIILLFLQLAVLIWYIYYTVEWCDKKKGGEQ